MKLFLNLAWRNIWRHRRRTVIVVLAIALGLAMMMFYDGIMAGFTQAIYSNAVKVLGGNIQVHAQGYMAQAGQKPLLPIENDQQVVSAATAQPQVQSASRRINTSGLASNREGAFPVAIVGIEPSRELPVSLVAQNVASGRFLADDDQESIYIGQGLASAMGVEVGDRITLVGRAKGNKMRRHTMTIAGIFDVGMREIEKKTVYMSLAEAQYLYGLDGQSTEVAISLHQLGEEPQVMSALEPSLNGYEISSWEKNFPEMEAAINSKGGVMDIFSVIIMVIAGIGILNLLLMAVFERTREIGLLGALGLKPGQITTLFLLEGAMMGVVGVVFGVLLGLLLNGIFMQVGLDYSQFASVTEYTALISDRIYPSWGVEKIALRTITVLVISVLAAWYPAREAARHEPAEALHYV